jgi:MFS family permease
MAGNKKYLWAVLAFLTIPVILVAGGALFVVIDPEKLAGHTHYARNFQLLQLARHAIMLAMFGASAVAWFVACALLIRARNRNWRWLLLAFLGPPAIVILSSLRDLYPRPCDLYEAFIRKLNVLLRAVYETGFVIVAWTISWEMMLIKREATISFQAAMRGVPRAQIIDEQNASGGMYAFSELNEVMYFFVFLYLVRPICVNVVGSLFRRRGLDNANLL